MNGIRIVTGDVSDTATRIRSLNAEIYEILQKMKADMNSLNGTWVSEGGEEIRSRFLMFANRFETQKQIIDSYADYLDLAAAQYDSVESVIAGNASSMQS